MPRNEFIINLGVNTSALNTLSGFLHFDLQENLRAGLSVASTPESFWVRLNWDVSVLTDAIYKSLIEYEKLSLEGGGKINHMDQHVRFRPHIHSLLRSLLDICMNNGLLTDCNYHHCSFIKRGRMTVIYLSLDSRWPIRALARVTMVTAVSVLSIRVILYLLLRCALFDVWCEGSGV